MAYKVVVDSGRRTSSGEKIWKSATSSTPPTSTPVSNSQPSSSSSSIDYSQYQSREPSQVDYSQYQSREPSQIDYSQYQSREPVQQTFSSAREVEGSPQVQTSTPIRRQSIDYSKYQTKSSPKPIIEGQFQSSITPKYSQYQSREPTVEGVKPIGRGILQDEVGYQYISSDNFNPSTTVPSNRNVPISELRASRSKYSDIFETATAQGSGLPIGVSMGLGDTQMTTAFKNVAIESKGKKYLKISEDIGELRQVNNVNVQLLSSKSDAYKKDRDEFLSSVDYKNEDGKTVILNPTPTQDAQKDLLNSRYEELETEYQTLKPYLDKEEDFKNLIFL